MADFVKSMRSLNSFGVAGVLSEVCHVFHSNLFGTRDIGRVSDLLAARFRESGADELKLRSLLLFGAFEAYRAQSSEVAKESPLEEPISMECGIDGTQIAIGIFFSCKDGFVISPDGLKARLEKGGATNPFEELLTVIYSQADRLILRTQVKAKRAEIIALIQKSSRAQEKEFEFVDLDAIREEETPSAKTYTELGDLDYATLLKSDPLDPKKPSPTGEILALGGGDGEDSLTRSVANTTQHINDGLVKIEGETIDSINQSLQSIDAKSALIQTKQLKLYQARIDELLKKISFLEDERRKLKTVVTDGSGSSESKDEQDEGSLKKFIKKIWSGKPEETEISKDDKPETIVKKVRVVDSPDTETEIIKSKKQGDDSIPEDTEKMAEVLAKELNDDKAGSVLREAQSQVDEIKKEMTSARARRWLDRLMADLTAEKKQLFETAEKLNGQLKVKDNDYKTREKVLREELVNHADQIRAKNNIISQLKNQLSQAQTTLKNTKVGSREEDAGIKQKYALSQKLLSAAKEDIGSLKRKLEETKSQMVNLQMSQKNRGPSFQEFSTLQMKYERMVRQSEEFKRSNQILLDQMNERKDASGSNVSELKKRLDGAIKLANKQKKESEQLQAKLEEYKRSELKLKMELGRTTALLKNGAEKPGGKGGSSPPQAA